MSLAQRGARSRPDIRNNPGMTERCRLVTFNVAHGRGLSFYQGFVSRRGLTRNLDKIAGFLRETDADLVALQEIDGDSHWNKRMDMPSLLAEKAGYDESVLGVNTKREGRKPLNYGNALLSRLPVAHWENRPFGNATLGEKGFLYAEVKLGALTLPLVNLHLCYKSPARRRAQIARLMEFLSERSIPPDMTAPVICGDFNAPARESDDAVRELLSGLRLVRGDYRIHPVDTPTFHALRPTRRLDFVFLPAGFKLLSCEVPAVRLSDHRPVLVEFRATL